MRLRSNKLLYLPVGGALAAGLLVSAFALPQTNLVASQECYGPCSTTTTLSVSRSTVHYGQERTERFSVRVSSGNHQAGVPTGSVTVQLTNHMILCRVHLSHATGSCAIGNWTLKPGSYLAVAQYSGDKNFKPSTSITKHFTVVRAASATSLSLARSTVRPGQEQVFRVRVRPRVPTGSVAVRTTQNKLLCSINLTKGRGSCSVSSKALKPGRYTVVAQYGGDGSFNPSRSVSKSFTVTTH